MIDGFDFDKYMLIPLESEKSLKKVLRSLKIEEANKALQDEISSSAGGSRFGNKFKSTDYEERVHQ